MAFSSVAALSGGGGPIAGELSGGGGSSVVAAGSVSPAMSNGSVLMCGIASVPRLFNGGGAVKVDANIVVLLLSSNCVGLALVAESSGSLFMLKVLEGIEFSLKNLYFFVRNN